METSEDCRHNCYRAHKRNHQSLNILVLRWATGPPDPSKGPPRIARNSRTTSSQSPDQSWHSFKSHRRKEPIDRNITSHDLKATKPILCITKKMHLNSFRFRARSLQPRLCKILDIQRSKYWFLPLSCPTLISQSDASFEPWRISQRISL